MRTLYDSTNWSAIPTTAQMVAGYVPPSGFAWPQSAWNRFPNSIHVRITPQVSTTGVGVQVLDVEQGDATPAQAPGWVARQRSLGQDPTVYCSASLWPTVQRAFAAAGVPHPCYWIAAYPGGGPTLPTLNGITAVAHQYADPATSGGDYDLSVVADYWPGVDQGGNMTTPVQIDLNQPLPDPASVAGTGTVGEALTVMLGGIAGKRNAGAGAVEEAQIDADLQHVLAAVAGADSDVKAGIAQVASAIAALPAGQPPTDAQMQALTAAVTKALPGYTVNITPTAGSTS